MGGCFENLSGMSVPKSIGRVVLFISSSLGYIESTYECMEPIVVDG
jgi:hypothetical protein